MFGNRFRSSSGLTVKGQPGDQALVFHLLTRRGQARGKVISLPQLRHECLKQAVIRFLDINITGRWSNPQGETVLAQFTYDARRRALRSLSGAGGMVGYRMSKAAVNAAGRSLASMTDMEERPVSSSV